jgi:hypothetical protein
MAYFSKNQDRIERGSKIAADIALRGADCCLFHCVLRGAGVAWSHSLSLKPRSLLSTTSFPTKATRRVRS